MTEQEQEELDKKNAAEQDAANSQQEQEQTPKSKADWLQELEDSGIVDNALEWDNLTIIQIECLLNRNAKPAQDPQALKSRKVIEEGDDEGDDKVSKEIIARRRSEQKNSELKKSIAQIASQLSQLVN